MKKEELVKKIDHTILRPNATHKNIEQLCEEAKKFKFRAVCVHPCWIKKCSLILKNTNILIATVNDFPLGCGGETTKTKQAYAAKMNGANEIDTVINLGLYLDKNFVDLLWEIKFTAQIIPTKVILETAHLSNNQVKELAKMILDTGAIAIKTSTGFGPKYPIEQKLQHVEIMKNVVGNNMMVKASGQISTRRTAIKMINAGADIIGTSSSIKIMGE